jgi:predicted alpha/beta hydrolase family esterase
MHKWLKSQLEAKGFEVIVPEMPHPDNPTIDDWVNKLKEIIKTPDRDIILIGHSIGCQAILRYLEQLHPTVNLGKVILIAPWFILSDLETEEEKIIGKPWIETPIKETNVVKHPSKIVAIFSDDDPVVPMEENKKIFEERFGAEIIIENGKGHFTEEDGVTEIPVVLNEI